MLIGPQRARDVKVELFEQSTIEALQDELQQWLSSREEEELLGLSFDASGVDQSYRAYVLYTE